jgi:hypothetical protein
MAVTEQHIRNARMKSNSELQATWQNVVATQRDREVTRRVSIAATCISNSQFPFFVIPFYLGHAVA